MMKLKLKLKKREEMIAKFHELTKQLAGAVEAHDEEKQEKIKDEMKEIGGIEAYQTASRLGTKTTRGTHGRFASHNWVTRTLISLGIVGGSGGRGNGKKRARLLDVGSLHNFYEDDPKLRRLFKSVAIDLNAQDSTVEEHDMMEFESVKCFDVVVLSLVMNFEGNARKRGRMLIKARDLSVPGSGVVCVILPRACFENSRYMTHELFREMVETVGMEVMKMNQTNRLSLYVLRNKGEKKIGQGPTPLPFSSPSPPSSPTEEDGQTPTPRPRRGGERKEERKDRFPKKVVSPGPNRNNFTIIL